MIKTRPDGKMKGGLILTIIFSVVCALYMYPIIMVLMNSLKQETAITTQGVFQLPTAENFAGGANYVNAISSKGFLSSLGYSVLITVSSVALILLCCSMCAWYITRVNNWVSKLIYFLCVFSMVVPFQMVMFTLSQTADMLSLNKPWNICIIYLGFGAGLAVFMFAGFMKSIPIEIEEAAMIDGCNPIQTYFHVVFPILRPTLVSVGVLETMWVWNDYLLPTLVLDIKRFRTIPMLIQYFRGSYGRVEMGPMMASIMLTIIPIVIVYLLCQRYIIKGIVDGAVKG
jgi:raffinose/stachyose/melibiose transport system permease protein